MAKSLNLCQFIGNLGQDPEIRQSSSGSSIVSLSLGAADDYKDKNGNKVEQTNWIRVVAFGKLAEIIGKYAKKGTKMYVSGKQVTRKWQDSNGQDRYTTEIVANDMQLLDSRGAQDNANNAPQQQYQPAPQHAPAPDMDSFDQDVPFS